jgi:hypothetical protein
MLRNQFIPLFYKVLGLAAFELFIDVLYLLFEIPLFLEGFFCQFRSARLTREGSTDNTAGRCLNAYLFNRG